MAPEEKRDEDDDIFDVDDVEDAPPPQEFKRPKGLMAAKPPEPAEPVELKSGAAKGTPPPLQGPATKPTPPPASAPKPIPWKAPAPATPTPPDAQVRTERPAAASDPKILAALSAAIDQAEIRKHKPTPGPPLPNMEPVGEFDVKIDAGEKRARPSLRPLEPGEVVISKPVADTKAKPVAAAVLEGEMQVVKDATAKQPHSQRLKVTKPRKLLAIVDTTFARINMGDQAHDELTKLVGDYDIVRRTVPGIKDLAVECKILIEEEDADLVIACGMVGRHPVDKTCAHEASLAIQWAMLATNRHILEVFVHEDEAKDDQQLAWLMERRTREHAINAHWMVQEPEKLRAQAGMGLRQGFDDAGPIQRK